MHLADEDSFNAHLKRIREISTEVGEFLRQLRTSTYCNVSEFEAADYEIFFEFIDDVPAWEQFKKKRKNTLEKEEEEVSEANIEDLPVEVELADIPGFSLLHPEEDIEESTEPEEEPEIANQPESLVSESVPEPEHEETQAAEEKETVPKKGILNRNCQKLNLRNLLNPGKRKLLFQANQRQELGKSQPLILQPKTHLMLYVIISTG